MVQTVAKKKVLIAITKSNWGGAQRYVYDLATHMSKDRFDVAVIHGGHGVMAGKLQKADVRTLEVPSLDRDINPLRDVASFLSLIRILHAEKPDVLHLNSSKVGFLGALAGRLVGIPHIVFTAHGWAFHEDRSFISRALLYSLAYCTTRLAHTTIAISDAILRAVDPHRRRRCIHVVRNGVAEESSFSRKEAREKLVPGDHEHEFWFGTVAELHPIKGISYAIEAFAHHAAHYPTAHYVLIGDGEARTTLESRIRDAGLTDRIHVVGFKDDARQLLPAFDVFVLPSISEGLSYSILEAGAARLPVIATRTGGIPEIIEDGESGVLVPVRDPGALSRAFERLQNEPMYREKLAVALHEKITSLFSVKKMVQETLKNY